MHLIRYPFTNIEEMIALDELFLKKAESDEIGETLRFWDSGEYFIALGRAGRISPECFMEKCERDNVKIIRRISGGGAVLEGPGCLNYSLILSYKSDDKYRDIRCSYQRILEKIADSFRIKCSGIEVFSISDIALNNKKFSGNAQARKRKYFLHHGTVLYNFDLQKISVYLKHPPNEPEYRKGRPHKDFLANLPFDPEEIKRSIQKIFLKSDAICELTKEDLEELKSLSLTKYSAIS